ncbi:MAG: hypothetical protein ACRCYR_00055 [Phycicoccus sp.]
MTGVDSWRVVVTSIATAVVATSLVGCSSESEGDRLDGRWASLASPTVGATMSPGGSASATPSASASVAVSRELDELSRNLRDLSQAPSSRESLPALADALADTRTDLGVLRGRAFGARKSCTAVAGALTSTRSDAARTTSAAADVRARNQVRSALHARGERTLARLTAAASAGSRTPVPAEAAAISDARTTFAGASDQIARAEESASDAVATAGDLVDDAEALAVRACPGTTVKPTRSPAATPTARDTPTVRPTRTPTPTPTATPTRTPTPTSTPTTTPTTSPSPTTTPTTP